VREINTIVCHHSASQWGQVNTVRQWHLERGFSDIGYHYVICNLYPTYNSLTLQQPSVQTDGLIQDGRPIEIIGAHVKGHNEGSVGICLIGGAIFTLRQLCSLRRLITRLTIEYPSITRICGHRDLAPSICPEFEVAAWWMSGLDTLPRRLG